MILTKEQEQSLYSITLTPGEKIITLIDDIEEFLKDLKHEWYTWKALVKLTQMTSERTIEGFGYGEYYTNEFMTTNTWIDTRHIIKIEKSYVKLLKEKD
jgi:hypothetical protein